MFREGWVVLVLTASAVAQQPLPLPSSKDALVPVFELEEAEHGEGITIDPILLLTEKRFSQSPIHVKQGMR